MSDEILNEGPKVLASIVIELVEIAPGQTGTRVRQTCPDEIAALGLIEKGKQILAMLFAQQAMQASAPRIAPVNGMPRLPESLRRYFNG